MKKQIQFLQLFILLCTCANAQHGTVDSAYVFKYPYSGAQCLTANAPATAPSGPDYGNLWKLGHPVWYMFSACGSNAPTSGIVFRITPSFYTPTPPIDTFSMIIWGPFYDTLNIMTRLTSNNIAFTLNYFLSPYSGSVDITFHNVQTPGIYIMMVGFSDHIQSSGVYIDPNMSFNDAPPVWYDNRCGVCNGSIVNYLQSLCIATFDTITHKNMLIWDAQDNYGIGSFDIQNLNPFDSLSNVPVTSPDVFIDSVNDPNSNAYTYRILSRDSCGVLAIPFWGIGNSNPAPWTEVKTFKSKVNLSGVLSWNVPSTAIPGQKYYIYRGGSESTLQLLDSTPSNSYTDLTFKTGLNFYSVSAPLTMSCSNGTVNEIRSNYTYSQDICMVVFDSATQKNAIVWDDQPQDGVTSFNIYRESAVIGQFDSIGNVAESSPAIFIDQGVNPNTKSYRYRVMPCDANGVMNNVSASIGTHTTMHMQASAGLFGEVNLSWNPYAGFSYATYYLYRGTSTASMQVIDSIAANTTSYTDYTPPSGLNYYRVTVRKPGGCHPDSTTLISEALSNASYAVVTGISQPQAAYLKLTPNPSHDFAVLDYSALKSINQIDIVNSKGQVLQQFKINASGKITIDTRQMSPGVYYVKADTDKGVIRKKLVVY